MNAPDRLTDAALEAMLARLTARARPADLQTSIMAAVVAAPQRRGRWWPLLGRLVPAQSERRVLWAIAVVGLLLALAATTAFVGSRLLEHPAPPAELVPTGIEYLSATVPVGPSPVTTSVFRPIVAVSADEAWAMDGNFETPLVWHYAKGAWTSLPTPAGSCRDLLSTREEALWIACESGTFVLRDTSWTRVGGDSWALAVDPAGEVWATDGAGVVRSYAFDGRTWAERAELPSTDLIFGGTILSAPDDGTIWLGSLGGWGWNAGLVRYRQAAWESMDPRGGGVDFLTTGLTVGRDGQVWMAGTDMLPIPNGVTQGESWIGRFDGTRWTVYTSSDGLPLPDRYSSACDLAVAPDGTIWAATMNGLAYFDGTRWTTLGSGTWFGAVSVAADGSVWFNSTNGVGRVTMEARPTPTD